VALEEEGRIRNINPLSQFHTIKILLGLHVFGPQKTASKTCLTFPNVYDVAALTSEPKKSHSPHRENSQRKGDSMGRSAFGQVFHPVYLNTKEKLA
jgi:hypothetical protein